MKVKEINKIEKPKNLNLMSQDSEFINTFENQKILQKED